jgi:hypothetical protein
MPGIQRVWPVFVSLIYLLIVAQSQATSDAAQPARSSLCRFVDVASAAGIRHKTIFGGEDRNTYLLETTGCGVAFFDFDNDGWLDLFVVHYVNFGLDMKRGCFSAGRKTWESTMPSGWKICSRKY